MHPAPKVLSDNYLQSSCSHHSHRNEDDTCLELDKYLGAGTLTFRALRANDAPEPCDHWTQLLNLRELVVLLENPAPILLDALAFLIRYSFIAVSWQLVSSFAVLRVFIVPSDCGLHRHQKPDQEVIFTSRRRHLRTLLAHVSDDLCVWLGHQASDTHSRPIYTTDERNDLGNSVSEIFNNLSLASTSPAIEIPHFLSTLYPHQMQSVAAMIDMEQPNRITKDPLFVPLRTYTGRFFYLQPSTLDILGECPMVCQNQGGILCEELGTGKTVITLALISSTLDELAKPPELDEGEVLTHVALRHFPHSPFADYRSSMKTFASKSEPSNIPSLVETLCHYMRANPDACNLNQCRTHLAMTNLWEPIRMNVPFYADFQHDFTKHTSARRRKAVLPQMTYLTAATLIVLPPTLVAQWNSEILKHCSSAIRILTIRSESDIPAPRTLATDYDIVLIQDTVISTEASRIKNTITLNQGYSCNCPEFSNARIPRCTCKVTPGISPFLQLRWKRLVRDEGHNAVSQSTELNRFLRKVSAERRWIITGTPTTNLLGLSFGGSSPEAISNSDGDLTESSSRPSSAGLSAVNPTERESALLQAPKLNHFRAEREDLRKLGSLLSDFLGVLPFANDDSAWTNLVVNGLMGQNGPERGSVRVLHQVMSANMVRHRICDIERHVKLPPYSEEVILLDLSRHSQIMYNVLLAGVVVNAVDSERVDQDYLFHPSNTKQLALVIENMSHSLFWRTDEDVNNAFDSMIRHAEGAMIHAAERNQAREDIELVQKALKHLRAAQRDVEFNALQSALEIPYRIFDAAPEIYKSWRDLRFFRFRDNANEHCLMYPSLLLELRNVLTRQPLLSDAALAERAALLREKRAAETAFVEARKKKADRLDDSRNKGSSKKQREAEREHGKSQLQFVRRAGRLDAKERLKETQGEYLRVLELLKQLPEEESVGEASRSMDSTAPKTAAFNTFATNHSLLINSPHARMMIGCSTSAKLNFIIQEVQKYSSREKILIFSKHPLNLLHIAEALELLGVRYLQFTSEGRGGPTRDQILAVFEKEYAYRVMLMELKHGARGLNIVSASRVIFCEPVWHADVESQAVKRVHRIGQTRPVTVKTLAIRATYEEYMIHRRRELRLSSDAQPGLADEKGVRHFLQNPVFLEGEPDHESDVSFPLLRLPDGARDCEREEVRLGEKKGSPRAQKLTVGSLLDETAIEKIDGPQPGNGDKGVLRSCEGDVPESPPLKRRRVQFVS